MIAYIVKVGDLYGGEGNAAGLVDISRARVFRTHEGARRSKWFQMAKTNAILAAPEVIIVELVEKGVLP